MHVKHVAMIVHILDKGAPLAHLVECHTLDRKVVGTNLTRGVVLCP